MKELKHESNDKNGRFTLEIEGKKAGELTYQIPNSDLMIIDHTEVDKAYGGKGYAQELVQEAVSFARQHGMKIKPLCSYAHKVISNDAGLNDIMEP